MKLLIVGQGIAGSCLALELLGRGHEVVVADPTRVNRSSSIAAGLVNPLVLKRMKKVWRADEFEPHQREFYEKWAKVLESHWVQEVPVFRRFHDIAEQNKWSELAGDEELSSYLDPKIYPLPSGMNGRAGMAKVNRAYWLNTQAFMDSVQSYLTENQVFVEETVAPSEVVVHNESVEWKNVTFDRIIWANGIKTGEVDGFPIDALRPSKGELLRIRLHEDWQTDAIIKAGVFILPLGRKELRVGATYDHFDLSEGVSEKGQQFLEGQVRQLINVDYEIIGREWGIRPTTKDRRPILGCHPEHDNVYFFNGLGSRGVFMAPLLASELSDYIIKGVGLRPDVDVARFY